MKNIKNNDFKDKKAKNELNEDELMNIVGGQDMSNKEKMENMATVKAINFKS